MPTFEELARRAQGLTNLTPPMPLAVQWASDRVHELLGKRRVAIYKRNLELHLQSPITVGSVTTARGSKIITGDVTAQAAWASLDTSFPEGWFIRSRAAWYRIASKTATSIVLESPFAEDDNAGVTYTLYPRYHTLPLNVYQVDEASFTLARTGQPLTFISEALHHLRGSTPHTVHEIEPAASGARQLEISPYPMQSELITYAAYIEPPPFTYASALPLGLDIHHMLPGLMADFYAWAIKGEQDAQKIALILNEKARCLTRFESAKEQALMHLESSRTTAFILMAPHRRGWAPGGIHDAYSEIWARP